jgi:hypothetical protein
MEIELLQTLVDVKDLVDAGITRVDVAVVGTEQGLQVRMKALPGEALFDDWKAHMSVSYADVLRLSFDMEKGKLQPPYGIPGTGLEVNHWLWKKGT